MKQHSRIGLLSVVMAALLAPSLPVTSLAPQAAWAVSADDGASPAPKPTPEPLKLPNFAPQRIKRGEEALKKNQLDIAEEEFMSAALIDENNYLGYYGLGRVYFLKKDYKEAIQHFEASTKIVNPTYAITYINSAKRFAKEGLLREACIQYQKALAIDPKAGDLVNKGVDALSDGGQANVGKAMDFYRQAIKKDPRYADAYYKLGTMYYQYKGDYGNALANYQLALKHDPGNPAVHYRLGLAHFRRNQKGDLDKAITYFQGAVALRSDDADYQSNLGIAYLKKGRHKDAIKALRQAVFLNPGSPDVHLSLGNAYYLTKEYTGAIKQFKESIKLSPEFAEAYYNLGRVYVAKSELRPNMDQVEITPENATFYAKKGIDYYKMEMSALASENFEKYLSLAPSPANDKERAFRRSVRQAMQELADAGGRQVTMGTDIEEAPKPAE